MNLEALIFADVRQLTGYIRVQILIQIVNAIGRHFQGQRLELSTLGNSYVNISQTVTDKTNIATANT